MPVSPVNLVEERIPAENLRSVTLKAEVKPWQAAHHLLVDHVPAAIVGAVGTDTFVIMHFRVVGHLAPHALILYCVTPK